MKKVIAIVILIVMTKMSLFAQTLQGNKLPAQGKVGAGTINPLTPLHVKGKNLANAPYGLLAVQDSTNPAGGQTRAYITFLDSSNTRLAYIGPDSSKFVISNDQSAVVAISPYSAANNTLVQKVVVGSIPMTGDNNRTFQVYGTTYLQNDVGIGTTSPKTKLEVKGALFSSNNTIGTGIYVAAENGQYGPYGVIYATDQNNSYDPILSKKNLVFQPSVGSVGIGTTNIDPNNKLEIAGGNLALRGGNSFYFYAPAPNQNSFSQMYTDNGLNLTFRSGNAGVIFQAADRIRLQTYSNSSYNDKLTILPNGNIGIGTTEPGAYKLAVEGTLGVRKLKVTQSTTWADYVFEPTYQLRSLPQVEAFIKQHKHLPDVPSAAEVEKNGLDVGDNQATLLRKIEELTLYIIDMKKQMDNQQKQINELRIQLPSK